VLSRCRWWRCCNQGAGHLQAGRVAGKDWVCVATRTCACTLCCSSLCVAYVLLLSTCVRRSCSLFSLAKHKRLRRCSSLFDLSSTRSPKPKPKRLSRLSSSLCRKCPIRSHCKSTSQRKASLGASWRSALSSVNDCKLGWLLCMYNQQSERASEREFVFADTCCSFTHNDIV
jgi:hypothetical protein